MQLPLPVIFPVVSVTDVMPVPSHAFHLLPLVIAHAIHIVFRVVSSELHYVTYFSLYILYPAR